MYHSDVCQYHGGLLPQVIRKRENKFLEIKVNGKLEKRGWEPVLDPFGSIANLAGEIHAFKDVLQEKLNAISKWEYEDVNQIQYIRPIIDVYTQALDRCAKIDAEMIRLGLDAEKLKQAKERPSSEQAQVLGAVLDTVLNSLGLTQEQQSRVPEALRAALSEQGLL